MIRSLLLSLAAWSSLADDQCALYLAPSSIPNAGLGIFTAKTVQPGHTFNVGDVLIPAMDIGWHNNDDGSTEKPFWLLTNYVWQGSIMGMHREVHTEDVSAYAPGLDCAINCHLALINVDRGLPQYDTLLHRKDSPGAGAITPYSNASTIVAQTIPAGGELFKFYGDSWFETRPGDFGNLFPLSTDYLAASSLVKRFHTIFQDEDRKNYTSGVVRDLFGLVVGFGYPSRTLNAMPKNMQELQQVVELGIRSLHQPSAIRENLHTMPEARCIDFIRAGPSTIPHAGRGAFATRAIAKGQVITGSPLVHVPDRNILHMYGEKQVTEAYTVRDTEHPIGKQIFLNYCWGHRESTLLLCPYGPGITLMNHDAQEANVKIEWAPNGHAGHTSAWLDLRIDEMYEYSINLGFDFIALRDIQEGEELFVDYGEEWQEAWNEHVASWGPVEDAQDYMSAAQFNAKDEPVLRTLEEQRIDPYPPNLQVVCDELVWYKKHMRRDARYDDVWDVTNDGYPCDIVERFEKNETLLYTVHLYEEGSEEAYEQTDVPRNYISFRDYHETTDMHLPNAFRHDARIPDRMFPENWKNLKKEEETSVYNDEHCLVYLAPSTIPNAGLGIFTAVPVREGQTIGYGDVIIPLMDVLLHNHNDGTKFAVLSDYIWDGLELYGMHREVAPDHHVEAFAPGMSSLINSIPGLINTERAAPTTLHAPHRSVSPSAGSMTPYFNSSIVATMDIPAGSELSVSYGEDWFQLRSSMIGPIPTATDFDVANRIVKRFRHMCTVKRGFSVRLQQDLFGLVRHVVDSRKNKRLKKALPNTWQGFVGATRAKEGLAWWRQHAAIRHEHSNTRCADHIRPGWSTIPHAGRGAFATRDLQKGRVITGSSLLHLPDRDSVTMYGGRWAKDGNEWEWKTDTAKGDQILLNYCWGHAESSLLLCPNGPGVGLMNHHAENPNVKMEWSPDGEVGHREAWLHKPLDGRQAPLALDFIALRDIAAGEELLIDYGPEWQDAWDQHVSKWKRLRHTYQDYVSAAQLNHNNQHLKTLDEQASDPYPPNVQMVCHESLLDGESLEDLLWPMDQDGVPCQVAERDGPHYTVHLLDRTVHNVPREMISFRDAHESTDLHLFHAFRHDARIPDRLFPDAWKDRKSQNNKVSHDEL